LPRKFVKYCVSLWHGGGNRILVWFEPHQARANNPLESDDIGRPLEQVPIIDVHQLVHAPRSMRMRWSQRWLRQHAIKIAQDRLALVEPKVSMVQYRHPAEGVAGKMLWTSQSTRRNGVNVVARTFLLQCDECGSAERTAGYAVHYEILHLSLPVMLLDSGENGAVDLSSAAVQPRGHNA
jgi:hypothetical protein